MTEAKRYFFCGIGGSGMLPLATIARARGAEVWGSDRGRDQGRTPEKFTWLESTGIRLFAQDGSGVQSAEQILVASAAVEDSVPDIAQGKALACPRMTRAELNASLFNDARTRVGVAGTSGKSTVTGMIGWILDSAGRQPTVMNGAVMRNYADAANGFASALVGGAECYVSEVDESDGSIALYQPTVAVVTNVSLDHKSLDELHRLFGDFCAQADTAIINADDAESAALRTPGRISFGFGSGADVRAIDPVIAAGESRFTLICDGLHLPVTLRMVGRHNISNALAAIAATRALGVSIADAVTALASFAGLARRYEVVGEAGGVTVIDDFAHNPDKVAATLAAATATEGRLLLFFQPHGYGPLKQMGAELADAFAQGLRKQDRLYVSDPVYYGGTVERSDVAKKLVYNVFKQNRFAAHMPRRESCADAMLAMTRSGDRILVLGARDDTLTEFARDLVARLESSPPPPVACTV